MYLVDTNIFLEILLRQANSEACRVFLQANTGKLFVSDFSIHSIGVILLRGKKHDVFLEFLDALMPAIEVVRLNVEELRNVQRISAETGLDFDDSLQLASAQAHELTLVTLDQHFLRIAESTSPMVHIVFL